MKLDRRQASMIKRLLSAGEKTQTEIAKDFGVSVAMVNHIKSGKAYADVGSRGRLPGSGPVTRLTEKKVLKIKALLVEGKLSQTKIAAKCGCTPAMVTFIKQGKAHAGAPTAAAPETAA